MTTKHTPGPWRLGPVADTVVADTATAHERFDHVKHYGGHLIAESIEAKNRALIAAAPELLELVVLANHGTKGTHTIAWQDKARAAIAKATGSAS